MVITGTMATVFFGLSLLGLLAFAGLLIMGLHMWGEEQAAKRAALSKPPPAQPEPKPEPPPTPEPPAETPAPTEPAAEVAAAPAPMPEAPAPATPTAESPAAKTTPPVAGESGDATSTPSAETKAPAEAKAPGIIPTLFSRPTPGQEILRVVRSGPADRLVVYIAGKPYANFHDLQDELVEQDFMTALSHLQAFAQNAVLKAAPAEPESTPPPAEAPAPPPARVVYHTTELPPLEVPSMRPFQQFQKLRKKPEEPKIVIKSIIEQIEDYLQDKIAGTQLARRGVHVRAESRGNAVFLFEGKVYANVDDVPDAEAQQAIREAIADWEKKT